jgi:2'-5' RNA ligase
LENAQIRFKHFVRDAKWVNPHGIHLTLKFLGYVDPDRIPEIQDSLTGISNHFPPFPIRVSGCGFFPNARRPNVLWAGVHSESLLPLHQQIESSMERLGFEKENRPFSPHLTLARFKNTRGPLPSLIRETGKDSELEIGDFAANSFSLYESILKRQGAEYHNLKEFLFAKDSRAGEGS